MTTAGPMHDREQRRQDAHDERDGHLDRHHRRPSPRPAACAWSACPPRGRASARATLVPNISVWMIIADSVRRSSTPVRVRQAVEGVRAAHARLDLEQRLLDLLRPGWAPPAPAPAHTRPIAASSDRPASTQVTSRSIESGSASLISCCRSRSCSAARGSGRKNAIAIPMKHDRDRRRKLQRLLQVRVDLPQDDDDDDRQQQLDAQEDLDGVLGAIAGVNQRSVDARQLLAARRLHQPRERAQETGEPGEPLLRGRRPARCALGESMPPPVARSSRSITSSRGRRTGRARRDR